MKLTYILVDFENVQPTDMGLLNGEQHLNLIGPDTIIRIRTR